MLKNMVLFVLVLVNLTSGCATRKITTENTKVVLLGSVPLELVHCPAGTFTMGSPIAATDRVNHETQHPVTLTKPFWLGKTEVTQAQWQALMGTNPSNCKGADLPVDSVSWDEAVSFCKKLTECERDRIPVGYEYRLPTEAEWEYACLAGRPGSDAIKGQLKEMRWYDGMMHPVGTKQPNAWGLYDMYGNAWEFCLDGYAAYPVDAVKDPIGSGTDEARVFRLGCWFCCPGNYFPPSYRFGILRDSRRIDLGFRVALAPVVGSKTIASNVQSPTPSVAMVPVRPSTPSSAISPRNQLSHSSAMINQKTLPGNFTVRYFNKQFLPGIAYFTVEAKIDGQTILFSAATSERVSLGEKVDIVEVDMSGMVPLQYYDGKKPQPILFIRKIKPM